MNRFIPALLLLISQGVSAQQMSWITACAEQNFCLTQNTCSQGTVFLVEKAVTNCGSPLINYSYKIDLNSDNVVDIQSSADTVSGPFVKGSHRITWKATDNCGNIIQCTYQFHVKDCQPPNLLCINGLTQGLDFPDCQESFVASQFVLSLSDNCTPTNQLKFGIRKAGDGMGFPTDTMLTFGSCDKGFNSIEVWVKDGNGLANLCSNYVIIQDGNNDCICNNDADLYFNGCAKTSGNLRLNNFKLKTSFTSLPGAALPVSTNYSQTIEDSCYTLLLDEIPFGQDYKATIRGERLNGPVVGVTTYDLVLISKHILAIEPFSTVYQMIAADVNKSNSVTTFDILETRKLILGIYDTFPYVPAWRFIRPIADPTQLSNFAAAVDTYQITLTNLVDDHTFENLNFIGIKYGDINGSANLAEPPVDERALPCLLQTEDAWLEAGETRTIQLQWTENAFLEGWQLELKADPSKLQILSVEGLPEDQFVLNHHLVRALWADGSGLLFEQGKLIITLKVKALTAGRLSNALFLNPDFRPEAYVNHKTATPERRALKLFFGEKTDASTLFFPAHPNPFSSETHFELLLENASVATLEIFDLNGGAVYLEHFNLEEGLHHITIPATTLPAQGVFTYRIQVGAAVSSGRLVRI